MSHSNIMLTGLPRSGTTLACHLLNILPDTVALAEPINVSLGELPSREAVIDLIGDFAAEQRESLLARGVGISKQVGGAIGDNFCVSERDGDGLRQSRATMGEVRFDKSLSPDFRLVIKHPAAFTALLPELAERFSCFAVIRNPLSVLASWNTTRMPVNDGRAPAAELHDSALKESLESLTDRRERQVHLLSWYFGQYSRHLGADRILRYEDIVSSGGAALAPVAPAANSLGEPLESRNRSRVYDWKAIGPVAERLLNSDGPYWSFYSRQDVRDILGIGAA